MIWRIIWSELAEQQLDTINTYYCEKAGISVSKKLLVGIIEAPDLLKSNPEAGQIELSLQRFEKEYRFIVHKNYKIIYSVDLRIRQFKSLMYLTQDKVLPGLKETNKPVTNNG